MFHVEHKEVIMVILAHLSQVSGNLSAYFVNKPNELKEKEEYTASLYYISRFTAKGKDCEKAVFFDRGKNKLYETFDYRLVDMFRFHHMSGCTGDCNFTSPKPLSRGR